MNPNFLDGLLPSDCYLTSLEAALGDGWRPIRRLGRPASRASDTWICPTPRSPPPDTACLSPRSVVYRILFLRRFRPHFLCGVDDIERARSGAVDEYRDVAGTAAIVASPPRTGAASLGPELNRKRRTSPTCDARLPSIAHYAPLLQNHKLA
jgi:hypothetical protein